MMTRTEMARMEKARKTRQIRTCNAAFMAREAEKGKHIEGYFAVFDGIYQPWPDVTESIDPHAFDDALADDIRCLIDHETRLVLGRTVAGTLVLRVDENGLFGIVLINEKDTDATNVYARVERGDVSQCSFGFDILDEMKEVRADGSVHFTIMKVKLYEVSVVTFPAYKDTGVEARRAEYEAMRRREAEAWKIRMKARIAKWH